RDAASCSSAEWSRLAPTRCRRVRPSKYKSTRAFHPRSSKTMTLKRRWENSASRSRNSRTQIEPQAQANTATEPGTQIPLGSRYSERNERSHLRGQKWVHPSHGVTGQLDGQPAFTASSTASPDVATSFPALTTSLIPLSPCRLSIAV